MTSICRKGANNVKDRYSYTIPFEDLELWIELEEK